MSTEHILLSTVQDTGEKVEVSIDEHSNVFDLCLSGQMKNSSWGSAVSDLTTAQLTQIAIGIVKVLSYYAAADDAPELIAKLQADVAKLTD